MYTGKIIIKETDETDLINIMNLWNNGETMKYVGFPNGLGYNKDKIIEWYINLNKKNWFKHFSIYINEECYCGETGYGIDNIENKNVGLEIKLLPEVQGRGIAEYALRYIIEQIININKKDNFCNSVWVDPDEENEKALKLYKKLGFKKKIFPEYLLSEDDGRHIYMELILLGYKNNY
jgi:RimJ/RimL family protein N-acetyltransferase